MLTIGQLAESTGLSEKALRLYEKKGLIQPVRNAENKYRYYDEEAKETLQKIIMLRFLEFSLDQIYDFLEAGKDLSLEESLQQQKHLLEQRRKELDRVIYCIDRAIADCQDNRMNMDELLDNMKSIKKDRGADEGFWALQKHSDRAQDWNLWVFEQAQMESGLEVLDAGAGWGNLWRLNQGRIPKDMKVTCIDKHNTWADEFAAFVQQETEQGKYAPDTFDFLWGDMEEMELDKTYDRIFFNHVAYFMKDSRAMYEKLRSHLKEQGIFICTWGGTLYFREVEALLKDFWNRKEQKKLYERMQAASEKRLDRVKYHEEILCEIFPTAQKRIFEISLTFSAQDCYDFLMQTYPEASAEIEKSQPELLEYLKQVGEKSGKIVLKRDTYLFYCKK